MPVPKRKTSQRKRDQRRAQHKLDASQLSYCPQCHNPKLPHHVCPVCGTYRGRTVIEQKVAKKKE